VSLIASAVLLGHAGCATQGGLPLTPVHAPAAGTEVDGVECAGFAREEGDLVRTDARGSWLVEPGAS
jgi:hypothetical protein